MQLGLSPQPIDSSGWTAYTSTITPSAGSLTSAVGAGRYKTIGKTCYIEIQISITTNGTASGNLSATLPNTAGAGEYRLTGGERQINGKALKGIILGGATSVTTITSYDNSYNGADGAQLNIGGVYEIA